MVPTVAYYAKPDALPTEDEINRIRRRFNKEHPLHMMSDRFELNIAELTAEQVQ